MHTQQNELRAKQNQLYEHDPNVFAHRSLELSPFTAVKYQGYKVIVTYAATEYELAAINDTSTPELLDFCRRQYKDLWQKRFAEDLVVVLADMGHPINSDHTVNLTLIDPNTGEKKTIDRASLTEKNRQAVHAALNLQ